MFERVLDWYHRAYGLKFNSFRYFNAAGASVKLGEDHKHESHLIPLVLKRALAEQGKEDVGCRMSDLKELGRRGAGKQGVVEIKEEMVSVR